MLDQACHRPDKLRCWASLNSCLRRGHYPGSDSTGERNSACCLEPDEYSQVGISLQGSVVCCCKAHQRQRRVQVYWVNQKLMTMGQSHVCTESQGVLRCHVSSCQNMGMPLPPVRAFDVLVSLSLTCVCLALHQKGFRLSCGSPLEEAFHWKVLIALQDRFF